MAKHKHPAKQPATQIQSFSISGQMFSGPIPPPEILKRYNEIIPNGADRIMTMAEQQAAHRRTQEDRVIKSNVRSQTMGSIFGFFLGMTGILSGTYLIATGKDASGLTALISSLVILILAFLRARRGQEQERRAKREGGE